jgi:hypothetical protein
MCSRFEGSGLWPETSRHADTTTDTSGHGPHLPDSSDYLLRLFRSIPIKIATAIITPVRSRLTVHIPLYPLRSSFDSPLTVRHISPVRAHHTATQRPSLLRALRWLSMRPSTGPIGRIYIAALTAAWTVTITNVRMWTPFVLRCVPVTRSSVPFPCTS